ncbi:MAG: hypothetical protein JRH19_23325, partial [Deltaproteobacteria bacterium]|nr:hypothetical protein [Deltaproteobacteria bacterium]
PHRWSQPRAWLQLEQVEGGEQVVIRAALAAGGEGAVELFVRRSGDLSPLFAGPGKGPFALRAGEPRDLLLEAPPGSGPLRVGWQLSDSSTARRVRIDGVGIERSAASRPESDLASARDE